MADKMIVNSTNAKAVAISQVIYYEIALRTVVAGEGEITTSYCLTVKLANPQSPDIIFETSDTQEGINALTATFLAALND